MALTAGSIEIKLFADLARLQSDMNKANKTVDSAMRNIDKSVGLARSAFNNLIGGTVLGQLAKLSDEYKKFDAQLKLSTKTVNDYSIAYENVLRIGRTAQSDIGAIGVLYARLNNNLRDFNVTQNQVSSVTETISLALRTNNATVQETNSVMLQLSQSFGSGKLNGQEFLAVAEGAPALLRQLAKAMGVPYGALKDLSAQGKITREELLKAWTDPEYLASLRAQVKEVGTISSAITVLTNNLKQFVGEQDKAAGASKLITTGIIALADNINVLATVAIVGLIASIGRWLGVKAALAVAIVKEQQVTAAKAAGDVVAARAQVVYTEAQVAATIASNAGALSMGNNAKATTLYSVAAGNAAIAQTNLNRATAAANTAMVAGRGIIAALGGPIGALITVLGVAAVAFQTFGKSGTSALDALYEKAKRAREELEKTPEALIKATPGLLEQNAKRREVLLKREIDLQTQLDNLKAKGAEKTMPGYVGIIEGQLLKTQLELNDSLTVYHDLQLQRIEAEKTIKDTTDKSAAAEKFLRDQNIKIMSEEVAMQRKIIEMAKAAKDIDSASRNKIIEEATNKIRELTGAKKADKEADKERIQQLKEFEAATKRNEERIRELRKEMESFNEAQRKSREEAIGNNDELQKEIDKRNEAIGILINGEDAYRMLEIAKLEDAAATTEQIIAQAKLNDASVESIEYAESYLAKLREEIELKNRLREKDAIEENFKKVKKQQLDEENEKLERQKQLAKDLKMIFSSSFEDAIAKGKSFRDVLAGIQEDIIRLITRRTITRPLIEGVNNLLDPLLSGSTSLFSGLFNANGNVFGPSGVKAFANGGIVNSTTAFKYGQNKMGIMGEAGPEAIMPLSRINGELGVRAQSAAPIVNVNVHEAVGTRTNVEQKADQNGNLSIDIIVEQVESIMGRNIYRGSGLAPTIERRYGLNRAAGA